jgi:hypothetical protein
MRWLASFAAAAFLMSGGALAQPMSIDVASIPPAAQAEAPTQISASTDSTTSESQLTSARASHQEPRQLSTGPRDAQAPQSLSRPADGRTAAVERVVGTDRCDPAMPNEKPSDTCRKVIETRADDYARPKPTELSPEQRLLLDQQYGPGAADIAEATNRLATSGQAGNSTASQGIASIVLQQSAPQSQEPQKKDDPTTDASVQAVIQMLNQGPQN